METESAPCYMGRCPGCNNVVALTLDTPKYRKDVANTVAEWIRDGLIIERGIAKEARKLFNNCTCQPQPTETLPLFANE